jgi:arrestin-related trafficking adapter 4/5/7
MYSFMIPHKAFAVGDTIQALVRMSPISKGVSVLSISVDIKEHAVTNWKGRSESSSIILQSEAFNIVDGKATHFSASNPAAGATAQGANSRASGPPPSGDTSASRSSLTSLARSMSLINLMGLGGPISSEGASSTIPGHGAVTGLSLEPSTSARHQAFNPATMFGPSPAATDTLAFSRRSSHEQGVTIPEPGSSPPASTVDTDLSMALNGNCDVDTTLSILIPSFATPSHPPHPTSSDASNIPSPLSVAHKIEFRALLSNLDGHTSELRCALPINILDGYLLREVRSATHATRSLLFGNDTGIRPHGIGNDETDIVPAELPSYNSHVRDRVANAEMAASVEGGYGRVVVATNPLLLSSTPGSPSGNGWIVRQSPGSDPGSVPLPHGPGGDSAPVSGWSTPYDGIGTPPQGYSHGIRQDRNPIAFDQELMLSLGEVVRSYGPPEHSNSRGGSRAPTRAQSRASSPEPGQHNDTSYDHAGGLHPTTGSRGGFHLPYFRGFSTLGTALGAHGTHGATSSPSGSRPHSRTGHHPNSPISVAPQHPMENGATVASAEEINPFSRVPSYRISSRGFLGGGVTPLQLYRDLPSYEQAEASLRINRTQSDPSLTYRTRESRPGESSQLPD